MSTALIYPPGSYAKTEELIELAREVAEYGGIYISHIRNEGNSLLSALDELIAIARKARIPAEIYHLKATGRKNWDKMEEAIATVNAARAGRATQAHLRSQPNMGGWCPVTRRIRSRQISSNQHQ